MPMFPMAWRRAAPTLALLAALAGAGTPAQAAFSEPIVFGTAGTVTLTVDLSEGGFDHLVELAAVLGPPGVPLLTLTATSDPSPDVLGVVPSVAGASVVLGSFAAGEEIVLRITNVESVRLGTPGTLGAQIFTGSASGLNPDPGLAYSFVDAPSATTRVVTIEDLFGVDPVGGVLDGPDLVFTITLAPVPEPGRLAMAGAGLALMLGLARRRRAQR